MWWLGEGGDKSWVLVLVSNQLILIIFLAFDAISTMVLIALFFFMQYGFVNSALEKLIKRRFGVDKWEEIR